MDYSPALSNKSCQHGQTKSNYQEQSTGKNESKARKTVSVWLYQALRNYLKLLPCGAFLLKVQKIGLGYGAISRRDKEGSRICSSRLRGELSVGTGVWGVCRII